MLPPITLLLPLLSCSAWVHASSAIVVFSFNG